MPFSSETLSLIRDTKEIDFLSCELFSDDDVNILVDVLRQSNCKNFYKLFLSN